MVLAEAFGWNGFQCDDSRRLQEAFEAPVPSLVVIPIDYRENAKLTPRLGEMQMHIQQAVERQPAGAGQGCLAARSGTWTNRQRS